MGEISTILQNAILYVAGNEGLVRFNKAGYDTGTQKIVHHDGSLDLPRLMNMLLDVFPEEQASAITDNVLAKYVELSGEEQKKAQAAVEDARVEVEQPPVPTGRSSYEDNLAKYLETDASDVRDLINEARRIRMAMGKPTTTPAMRIDQIEAANPGPVHRESILRDTPSTGFSIPQIRAPPASQARVVEMSQETLESEIAGFLGARRAYTSVDIMDFIRYLKDKGYHFQENSVLEKVYTWLEERKSRERAMLMTDIQSFLDRLPWPREDEVSAYIEQKKCDGIVCEPAEIKRMILVEMIRKH
jgi:hypothetical protein